MINCPCIGRSKRYTCPLARQLDHCRRSTHTAVSPPHPARPEIHLHTKKDLNNVAACSCTVFVCLTMEKCWIHGYTTPDACVKLASNATGMQCVRGGTDTNGGLYLRPCTYIIKHHCVIQPYRYVQGIQLKGVPKITAPALSET